MRRVGILLAVAAFCLTACGDGDDEAGGDVDRYCELTRELDQAGDEVFAPLEEDEGATEEDFARAEREFREAHEDDIDELRNVAPDEIRQDVGTLLDAQQERAEGDEESGPEVEQAEQRITEFEEENCS